MENERRYSNQSIEQEPSSRAFLSVISDTQGRNAAELKDFAKKVVETNPENIVLLGDLFFSKSANDLLGQIKRKEYTEDNLAPEQKEVYQNYLKTAPHIRAIFKTLYETDPGVREAEEKEIKEQAKALLSELQISGRPVYAIAGNIEAGYTWKLNAVKDVLAEYKDIHFFTEPTFVAGHNEKGFIFWPTVNPEITSVNFDEAVKTIIDQVRVSGSKEIFLFTHEYLFKGLNPEAYKAKLEDKGLEGRTHIVPWYMPNAQRLEILKLMRELYAQGCEIKVLYGHIEDDPEITASVLEYLNMTSEGEIPEFPLVGLGSYIDGQTKQQMSKERNRRGVEKATVKMYQVPEGCVGVFKEMEDNNLNYTLKRQTD